MKQTSWRAERFPNWSNLLEMRGARQMALDGATITSKIEPGVIHVSTFDGCLWHTNRRFMNKILSYWKCFFVQISRLIITTCCRLQPPFLAVKATPITHRESSLSQQQFVIRDCYDAITCRYLLRFRWHKFPRDPGFDYVKIPKRALSLSTPQGHRSINPHPQVPQNVAV